MVNQYNTATDKNNRKKGTYEVGDKVWETRIERQVT